MTPIERRLQKVEAVVMPKPNQEIIGLVEPRSDAAPDDLTSYAAELAAAKASGNRIVVVREGQRNGQGQQDPDGIEYVPTLTHAFMFCHSNMPSERGNANLLVDVLQDVSGSSFKPVKLPKGVGAICAAPSC